MFIQRFKEDSWLKRTWTALGLFIALYCGWHAASVINGSFNAFDYIGLLFLSILFVWLGD